MHCKASRWSVNSFKWINSHVKRVLFYARNILRQTLSYFLIIVKSVIDTIDVHCPEDEEIVLTSVLWQIHFLVFLDESTFFIWTNQIAKRSDHLSWHSHWNPSMSLIWRAQEHWVNLKWSAIMMKRVHENHQICHHIWKCSPESNYSYSHFFTPLQLMQRTGEDYFEWLFLKHQIP